MVALPIRLADGRLPGQAVHDSVFAVVRHPSAEVAQLVEHGSEKPGVGGSIPPLGTTF